MKAKLSRFSLVLVLAFSFLLTLPLVSEVTPGANEIYLPFPAESPETESNNKDLPIEKSADESAKLITNPKNDINAKTVSESSPGSSESTKPKKKKKGKGDAIDPTEPPFKRGKALLTRNKKKSAESEFADSYSKEGANANPSRTENANLFGLDSKDADGTGLVEKIEDPDGKIKAQFELARSLDRMGVNDSEEKAYKEYLKLITSFPVHAEITPRAHLAIAILLFRRQEYRPSLHHLIKIMKDFKSAREFTTAHYYAGRIYESAWADRDLERAKKYYDLYLNAADQKDETPGADFKKDAMERRRLIESPLGI